MRKPVVTEDDEPVGVIVYDDEIVDENGEQIPLPAPSMTMSELCKHHIFKMIAAGHRDAEIADWVVEHKLIKACSKARVKALRESPELRIYIASSGQSAIQVGLASRGKRIEKLEVVVDTVWRSITDEGELIDVSDEPGGRTGLANQVKVVVEAIKQIGVEMQVVESKAPVPMPTANAGQKASQALLGIDGANLSELIAELGDILPDAIRHTTMDIGASDNPLPGLGEVHAKASAS